METIERSVEVAVPLSTAYNQWTQFEDLPRLEQMIEDRGQASGAWRGEV